MHTLLNSFANKFYLSRGQVVNVLPFNTDDPSSIVNSGNTTNEFFQITDKYISNQ